MTCYYIAFNCFVSTIQHNFGLEEELFVHKSILNIRAWELLNSLHSAGHSTAFNSVIMSKEYNFSFNINCGVRGLSWLQDMRKHVKVLSMHVWRESSVPLFHLPLLPIKLKHGYFDQPQQWSHAVDAGEPAHVVL